MKVVAQQKSLDIPGALTVTTGLMATCLYLDGSAELRLEQPPDYDYLGGQHSTTDCLYV